MDNHPLLSIIIPSHLPSDPLAELTTYLRSQAPSAELIVVTNGSRVAPIRLDHVRTLHIESGGVSVARNLGAKEARGKFLFFLDADAWPVGDGLQKLCHILSHAPDWMGVIQLKVIPEQGQETKWRSQLEVGRRRSETKGTFNTCFLPFSFPLLDSCGLVCQRELFLKIGGFDPTLERMEDRYLGLCYLRAGIILWPCLEVAVEKRLHPRKFFDRLKARWQEALGIQYMDMVYDERLSGWKRLLMFWKTLPPPASDPLCLLRNTLATIEEKISSPLFLFARQTLFPQSRLTIPQVHKATWQLWRLRHERFAFFFYFNDRLRVRDMCGVWCSDFSVEETQFLLQTFFSNEKKEIPHSFMVLALIKRGIAQEWLTRLS